jgi:uncharacterized protein YjgD (DUF1641 family)
MGVGKMNVHGIFTEENLALSCAEANMKESRSLNIAARDKLNNIIIDLKKEGDIDRLRVARELSDMYSEAVDEVTEILKDGVEAFRDQLGLVEVEELDKDLYPMSNGAPPEAKEVLEGLEIFWEGQGL